MRVKMLVEWTTAAVDGTHTVTYQIGETYEVPERVALPWIEKGRAVVAGKAAETKMEPAAPENKMELGAESNKTRISKRSKRISR